MQIELPVKVKYILDALNRAGYEGYAVGGCIRDSLLKKTPWDWDITTSARPEQVKKVFAKTIDTGIKHGTVTVLMEGEGFEVTTYRIDGDYVDGRHPSQVIFTGSLSEDLKRRDFTINAMAYNETEGLIDLFDGMGDLQRGLIRCVGDPKERFTEDALRMLRAVRFCAQLGFSMEEGTKQAICQLAPMLSKISAERIQTELVKLLVSDHPKEVRSLWETGIAAVLFPWLDTMMATPQNTPYHCYNVGEHTLRSLDYVPADKVLRLTMLLHDMAKPALRTTDERGRDHFKGHPREGARMAREVMRQLKFDNDTTDRVTALVLWHDDNPPVTPANIRRAIRRVGLMQYPDLFAVKRADTLAKSGFRRAEMLGYIDEYEAQYRQIMEEEQCVTLKDLAVNGKDLMEAGMKPGKELGEALNRLLELVLEHPEYNTREILLEKLRERA